ncbi:MAG: hypothetical protein R3313_03240 [Candidatus Saccharimonadales bacterium]|nr:hypothetical protein [Candidatus Saccharimonadales bacterium]
MNFYGKRSLGALVTLATLGYYAYRQGVDGDYFVLTIALIFEALVFWYFMGAPQRPDLQDLFGSMKGYLKFIILGVLSFLMIGGYIFIDQIPGSYLDWCLILLVISVRIYEDYVRVSDYREHFLALVVPIGIAAMIVTMIDGLGFSVREVNLHWIVAFFLIREVADWAFDLGRYWARGKS